MPIIDEVRKRRETAVDQGKVALEGARKPWYAAVGVGDLAYVRLNELQGEVQTQVDKLQARRRQLDSSTLREAVDSATTRGRKAYGAYAAHARETYESLAHRGEIVVRRMRRSHEVKETFEQVEHVVADAGRAVATAEEKVTHPGPMITTARRRPKTAPAKHPSHS
jgi:hypothetical protein